MLDPLVVVLALGGLALAGLGATLTVRGEVAGRRTLALAALLEAAVLGQAVVATVLLILGERPEGSLPVFVAYLVGTVLVLPAGILWALSERDRWTGAVLAVAGLAVTTMVVRLWDIWTGGVQIGAPPGG